MLLCRKSCRLFFAGLLSVCFSLGALAQPIAADAGAENSGEALLEKHAALASRLSANAYGRPLVLDSSETSNMVSGNAYAVLNAPFSAVSAIYKSPDRWCEVMILHINTKYCKADGDASPALLHVNIGKKTPQELADSYALQFVFRLVSSSAQFLAVQLNADKGPMGTQNYRIEMRAVALPGGKTFMLLRYSYGYGLAGRIAMQSYLATLGSGKVGFTRVDSGQKPVYVGGMRGTVERNTMRYYLAIEAYLSALQAAPSEQLNARLLHWFNATEQYPEQLHETDRASYLSMKKAEYQRQQKARPG